MAQKPVFDFEHITSKEGLAHNAVTAITQDQEGYLWIGTSGGLHRFDGNRFIVFNPEKDNPTSLSHSRVYSLFIDHENTLWVGTLGGGLNKYNHHEENFTRYMADKGNPAALSSNDIYAICEDAKHNLWVGTYGGGLNLLDRSTGEVTRYDLGYGIESREDVWNSIRAMVVVNDHEILIGLDKGGMVVFDTEKREVTKRYMHDPDNIDSISDDTINSFFMHDGKFLIGTWYGGVNEFDPKEGSFRHYMHDPEDEYSISSNIVMATRVDSKGGAWAGTWNNGLNYRPPGESKFYNYVNDTEDNSSISGNTVLAIFEDRQGIIWLGTRTGINKLQPYRNKFNYLHHLPGNDNSLSGNNVRAFAEDDNGNIWIGVRGEGLNKFDLETGKITRFKHDSRDKNSLPHNSILSLHADGDYLWIGTEGSGLARLDLVTNQFEDFRQNTRERSNAVFDIEKDEDGNIWFSTWGDGVNKFNPVTKTITNFEIDSVELNNNAVLSLFVEKDSVWIGSFGRGLIRLDRRTGQKTYFQDSSETSRLNPRRAVHYIYRATDGKLWIGMDGGGLALFNSKDGSFKTYTKENGLINNIVNGIIEDSSHNLWLTTYGGVSKFDPDKEWFINFDNKDGLQNDISEAGAILRTSSGMLFLGGVNGVSYFCPDSIAIVEYSPQVVLTGFNIYNKRITPNSEKYHPATSDAPAEIYIDYRDRIVSFEFNVFDFLGHNKIKYAYMLEGVDIDWVNTDANRQFASYSNLSPGNYNFYVKATNSYGEWNEKPLMVKVLVKPAFWQTPIFKIGVILLIIILVIFYIRIREKEQVKQQKILEEKVTQRTAELKKQKELIEVQNKELEKANATKNKFFQIIAHDLRSPIGGLYSLSDILLSEYDELDKDEVGKMLETMKQSGEKTFNLLNNLLDWARTQTNHIEFHQEEFNVIEVITNAKETLMPVAEKKHIRIETPQSGALMAYADRYMLRAVIQNLLSNAIKFTPADGRIKITANLRENDILVSVADTGVGIPEKIKNKLFRIDEKVSTVGTEKEAGTGLGLLLCKEFVELNKGELWFESTLNEGTTFYFTIPQATANEM